MPTASSPQAGAGYPLGRAAPPVLFETLVKPLRLGVPVDRDSLGLEGPHRGRVAKHFLPQFRYFRTGLKTPIRRAKRSILKPGTGDIHTRLSHEESHRHHHDQSAHRSDRKVPVDAGLGPGRHRRQEDAAPITGLRRGIYVSPEEQEKYDPALSEAIGWNCIQRRNFGLLWANDMQADVVAVVDDDNIPWTAGARTCWWAETSRSITTRPTCRPSIPWAPRITAPLASRLSACNCCPSATTRRKSRQTVRVDVQADFWNGDPDIDAVCRMEHAPECDFDPRLLSDGGQQDGPVQFAKHVSRRRVPEGLFPVPARRPDGRHLGRVLSPGERPPRRLEQGVGLSAAQRPRPGPRHAAGIPGLREQPEAGPGPRPRPRSRCWPTCPAARPGRSNFIGDISTVPKMLVTGAAGFVGRHMVRRLLEAGHEVHAD